MRYTEGQEQNVGFQILSNNIDIVYCEWGFSVFVSCTKNKTKTVLL